VPLYSWQLLETKQRFISQINTSKTVGRSVEDLDDATLSYAEIKALAAGDSRIKEKMDLDVQVERLRTLRVAHRQQQYRLEDIVRHFPKKEKVQKKQIAGITADMDRYKRNATEDFRIEIDGTAYIERPAAGKILLEHLQEFVAHSLMNRNKSTNFADMTLDIAEAEPPKPLSMTLKGFPIELRMSRDSLDPVAVFHGSQSYRITMGADAIGNIVRLENALERLPTMLTEAENELHMLENNVASARAELDKPFPYEDEWREKSARLAELNVALNMDMQDDSAAVVLDDAMEIVEIVENEPQERRAATYAR